ncbi:cupin domain-containing protein [Phytomonospora endophytica]|uniref:Quercetin dioxygenase-like cupin family protein n=1 Tax=Phytomonospora endophytica TaxID=714109 RepID=A0A841FYJ2_9ACTN|nr:cupin domain-containing protein [Phytomonospora endophytica]MBB6039813.1 quercetin dioxygenase-like cupin family protein [Phytomonospora endophytica]GIG70333.1 putative anti-ECFsigma factor, ChrR [Phytomonospora endophytica]
MTTAPEDFVTSVHLDDITPTDIAPGITRLALPGNAVAARAFDFAPGTRWPEVDQHPADELVYVADGELLDNGRRYPAGSFLHYWPGSRHQPGTETGARIMVFTAA